MSAKKSGIVIAIVMLVLIAAPLSYTGYNIFIDNSVTQNVNEASINWLEGSGFEVISVDAESADNEVILRVIGDGELPPIEDLEEMLKGKLYGKP
ncbi:MAG: hypothetical protein KKF16_04620 [Euryarchaeota archaeon]|nr:hypothetical protein [Euryarchaeota archaeon]MBU4547352.1 hypothetical protein [Euryarchaeota archaeon]MBU4607097.1 hypothetical protein [Euryarchaeota archaeon]MBV1729189.1 hypothetical protein [Methanobacterium sp.]MBV1755993.1 hypothetical protein [Methanobacterium sp.]